MRPTAARSSALTVTLAIGVQVLMPGETAAIMPIPWKIFILSRVRLLWSTLSAIFINLTFTYDNVEPTLGQPHLAMLCQCWPTVGPTS